jgi:hypothetical protein
MMINLAFIDLYQVKLILKMFQYCNMALQRKPLVTAHELEALLAKPVSTTFTVDTYFPFRLAILVLFSAIWFVRLTVFTQDVATDLFSNPAVQEFMMPALYFRAWILFVFISAGVWSYKNGKFPAIVFGLLFALSLFNLLFDISVFYSEKLTHQDARITFILMGRIFVSYILFLSMRRAHRIPQGRDKWNIFLPFKKSQRT